MKLLPFEYSVRNLGRSRPRLALSVLGSALVVLLVLAAAAFVRGMDRSIRATGGVHNVIVLGTGSEESIERSEISAAAPGIFEASVRGVRSVAAVPYLSPEVYVQLPVTTHAETEARTVAVRGITPRAMLVHDQAQIVEGRLPAVGAEEVLVGRMAASTIGVPDGDLAVGKSVLIDNRPWTVVGRFVAPGTVMDAELWVPLTDLMEATKRTTISCVIATLDPAVAEFADVAAFTKTRLELELAAMPEREYYAKLAAFFGPVRAVAWATAGLIGLGGLFGGLNTMYAAFASRVRELGTLQSIGFRRGAIVVSLVQESLVATAAGALLACGIGLWTLDGLTVRFSMGAFGLVVDSMAATVALGAGLALGLLGALPPAWRCLRLEIPVALKAV